MIAEISDYVSVILHNSRALTLAREMGEPFLVLGGLRTGDGSGDG
jgi:hypothetical protein